MVYIMLDNKFHIPIIVEDIEDMDEGDEFLYSVGNLTEAREYIDAWYSGQVGDD